LVEETDMADYQKMYAKLFNKVSDVICELQDIQRETEEIYINSGEPTLIVLDSKQSSDDNPDK